MADRPDPAGSGGSLCRHCGRKRGIRPCDRNADLDITIPGAAFRVSKVGGTLYVHWLESREDPRNKNRTLSLLANGKEKKKARVVIQGIGIEEATLMDNASEVDLSEGNPLRIIVQPQSQACAPKETVTLTVKAAGGNPPYQYQ